MKYVDEFRNPVHAQKVAEAIARVTKGSWTIMEICGGQTHSLLKFGIDALLPDKVELLHGPGCPVCVTPAEVLDKAMTLAKQPNVILCTYGDMLRVPGSDGRDLLRLRAEGADVRILYSALDALKLSQENPSHEVVFLAVGFETTAPAHAMAVLRAEALGLPNFSLLVSHVLVPPAIDTILSNPKNRVQGFLAAGHVCTVMGYQEYEPLAEKYKVPIVVTGFEPLDLLEGIYLTIQQLESGAHRVANQYARSVERNGNRHAQEAIQKVFAIKDSNWRGIGTLSRSGLGLRSEYSHRDAEIKFNLNQSERRSSSPCQSGRVLIGEIKPPMCPEFGRGCTPDTPLGATMVSSEGACAAYFKYRRHDSCSTAR